VVRRLLGGAGESFPLGSILLARLEVGGGTFCVFKAEEGDFGDMMRFFESSLELSRGRGGLGAGELNLVKEIRAGGS